MLRFPREESVPIGSMRAVSAEYLQFQQATLVIRHQKPDLYRWLKALWRTRVPLPPEMQRAKEVIAAIDKGGVPLNPARINDIARNLGLEVSRKAPVEETIQRIRLAVMRSQR